MEKNYVPFVPLSALLCVLLLIISVPSQAQTFVWGKSIGGSGNDNALAIAVDAAGNSYVTGTFSGSAGVDFNPSPTATASLTSLGESDMFIAKYDPAGNYVWAKQISGNGDDEQALGIAVDGNGATYITGILSGTADFDPRPATIYSLTGDAVETSMFIAKYDANGDLVWAVKGGAGSSGRALALDGSNNILITGSFTGTVTFGTSNPVTLTAIGSGDMFIAKYSSLGELTWIQSVGGTSLNAGTDIGVDAGGNVYMKGKFFGSVDFNPNAGTTILTAPTGGIVLTKYSRDGDFLWANQLPSLQNFFIDFFGLKVDPAGNSYITGVFSGTADFDPSTTAVASLSSAGPANTYVAKYDANGNYLWATSISSTSSNFGADIEVDAAGNSYVVGGFGGTADFDPSAGVANLTAASGVEIYLAKYTPLGSYVRATQINTPSFNLNRIGLDGTANTYLLGVFTGSIDVDPSAAVTSLTSNGGNDMFIAKYTDCQSITAQPATSSAVCAGSNVAVSVGVSSTVSGYQWFQNGTALSGQTTATLNLTNVQAANAGYYVVVVTNACISLTSTAFSLTVNAAPSLTITASPSLTITSVSTTTLTASGAASFSWSSGQSTSAISVTARGIYSVTGISSGCSGVTSVIVTVLAPLAITALSPAPNARTALANANVLIAFNQPLSTDPASLTTLRVFSNQQRGLLRNGQGGITTVSSNSLTFDPTANFLPGETLLTTITTSLQSSTGATFAQGQVHQFTVETGGTGRGNFLAHPTNASLAVGDNPSGLVLGDINGDGHLDLITANVNSNNLNVLLNDGTGVFTNHPINATLAMGDGPQGMALGDIDADGDLDLVVANLGSDNVSVRLNDGTGVFSLHPTIPTVAVGDGPRSMALGDIDADGDLDLITANTNSNNLSVRLNNGAGSFSPHPTTPTVAVGSSPQSMALGDLDGDGDLDLVATNFNGDNLSVRLNNGAGVFTPHPTTPTVTLRNGPQSVALGDLDGDGDLDLVAGSASTNRANVQLNDGIGNFTPHPVNPEPPVGTTPRSVALGDVDSDGDLDLITVSSSPPTGANVRLNNGTGNFTPHPFNATLRIGSVPRTGILGDLDADGDLDLIAANGNDDNINVFLNQPPLLGFAASTNPVCAGGVTTFTATVNNISIAYDFTLTNGTTTITGTRSTSAFSQSWTAAGSGPQTFTLTVVYSTTVSRSATTSLTVNTLPSLTVTASPSSTLTCANTSLTLTATAGLTNYRFSSGQNGNSNTLLVTAAGVYAVTATEANGCAASASTTITSSTAVPALSINASYTLISCTASTVSLSAIGSGTLNWSTGESTTVVSVTEAGPYSVTLTNASGCSAVANISIGGSTSAPSLSVTPSSSTLTCTNPTVSLSAVGTGTVRWSTGATTPVLSVNSAGIYSVTLTGSNTCTTVSSATVVSATVAASVSVTPGSGTLSCASPTVSLSAIGTGTVLWSTGATTPVISATVAGTYSVTLTNASGCRATASATVSGSVLTSVAVTADGPVGCGRLTATVIIQGSGASSYTLLGPSGYSAVNGTGVFSVTAGGSYTGLASQSGCELSGVVVVGEGGIPPVASNFRASGVLGAGSCSVQLLATAGGNAFVVEGPGGYVFSNVYRTAGSRELMGFSVSRPGTYTLTVYSGSCSASYTTVVTGTSCPAGQ